MGAFADLTEIVMRVRHADGRWSARPIWVVEIDGEAYVRSAFGTRSFWYRRVLKSADTEVEIDGAVQSARLEPVNDPELVQRVSGAYRAKYGLAWPGPVESMNAHEVAATTMRLTDLGEVAQLLA
ncbi:DUF2255 family protein [Streptosporangium sp. CA-135522]|uniref:DUF2255 family protein n=1 Tax=Streptosporangium sp. CA-135522 TaxID=3240072 RepID=UPI003D8E5CAF